MTTHAKQPLLLVRPIRQYEVEMPGLTPTLTAWTWKIGFMLIGLAIWICAVWVIAIEVTR